MGSGVLGPFVERLGDLAVELRSHQVSGAAGVVRCGADVVRAGGEEAGVGVVADDSADAVGEVGDARAAAGAAAHGAGRTPLIGGLRLVGGTGILLGDAVAVGQSLAG